VFVLSGNWTHHPPYSLVSVLAELSSSRLLLVSWQVCILNWRNWVSKTWIVASEWSASHDTDMWDASFLFVAAPDAFTSWRSEYADHYDERGYVVISSAGVGDVLANQLWQILHFKYFCYDFHGTLYSQWRHLPSHGREDWKQPCSTHKAKLQRCSPKPMSKVPDLELNHKFNYSCTMTYIHSICIC
jgi:hypothetical protein